MMLRVFMLLSCLLFASLVLADHHGGDSENTHQNAEEMTMTEDAEGQDDHGGEMAAAPEIWLPSLITDTPQAGFELAVKLARMGVKTTQPNPEMLHALRKTYATDADSLIASSQVIALHFQTISAANNYWRE